MSCSYLDVRVGCPRRGSRQRCHNAGRAAQLQISRREATVETAGNRLTTGETRPRPDDRPRSRVPRRRGRVDGRGRRRHHRPVLTDRSLHESRDGRTDVGCRRCRVDHADNFAIRFTHLQSRPALKCSYRFRTRVAYTSGCMQEEVENGKKVSRASTF